MAFKPEGGELKVKLNELLKVVDDNTRIQIRLKMFGSTFSTNIYKSALLKNDEAAELLTKEVKSVYDTEVEGISVLAVDLE